MNDYETEYIECPRCKAQISFDVNIEVSTYVDSVALDKIRNNAVQSIGVDNASIMDCTAYCFDDSAIPLVEDLDGFLQPTLLDGEEWWTNGHVLFRGRPLSRMPLAASGDRLSVEGLQALLAKYSAGNTTQCKPDRANDYRVSMEGGGVNGITLRSPVDICAYRWPGGQWRGCRSNAKEYGYAYFVDDKLMCINMGFNW